MTTLDYNLHTMGSGSFQDLGITIVEHMINRPVQVFSKTHDKGVDGLFDGTIEKIDTNVRSIIQCKHTSKPRENLTFSGIKDELPKIKEFIKHNSIGDYILLTNQNVSMDANLKIEEAFLTIGVQKCRIWGNEWVNNYVHNSPKLRMKVPRLYGLGDLSNILDQRVYKQAKLILESVSVDLKKFVPTDAFRKSVKALAEKKFVLLLGEPASGKSTIGSCMAISAIDNWESRVIYASKPDQIEKHLDSDENQLFLVDDAWGTTQFRDSSADEWNQILLLMNSAIKKNSRFVLTSRNYIWNSAKNGLKTGSFPLFDDSQVIIEVQKLKVDERAQMLYNHLKHGNQPKSFKSTVKYFLPSVVESNLFLPESARRFGNNFFTRNLILKEAEILKFFAHPSTFMQEVINGLSAELQAAVALVFLTNGKLKSPIECSQELKLVKNTFHQSRSKIIDALDKLNGSLLFLVNSANGIFWKFKHPTIGEAFAEHVSSKPELVEVYLRGAKPEILLQDVVCGNTKIKGARVIVPEKLYDLLLKRIENENEFQLIDFICNRADKKFAEILLERCPKIINQVNFKRLPIKENHETQFVLRLNHFGLLTNEFRNKFIERLKQSVKMHADSCYITDNEIRNFLTIDEYEKLNEIFEENVIEQIPLHIEGLTEEFNPEFELENYFSEFELSVKTYINKMGKNENYISVLNQLDREIRESTEFLEDEFKDREEHYFDDDWSPDVRDIPKGPLEEFFQDVDE